MSRPPRALLSAVPAAPCQLEPPHPPPPPPHEDDEPQEEDEPQEDEPPQPEDPEWFPAHQLLLLPLLPPEPEPEYP
ncbi:hypothetical protein [Streptomyces sp. NPDC096339]|uniref:hypothetical protein n=1 Tax=Streptomyces sp. NPDC096339 TaxID=3366086 RepID=UPI0038096D4B